MYETPNAVMYWDSKRWIVRLTLEPNHTVEIPYDAWVKLSAALSILRASSVMQT